MGRDENKPIRQRWGNKARKDKHPPKAPRTTPDKEPWVENQAFEEYYRRLAIFSGDEDVDVEADWTDFMDTIRRPLPITFRVISGTVHTDWVTELLNRSLRELKQQGDYSFGKLDWYAPFGEAYELRASREVMRTHPDLRQLADFLVKQSESGVIVRQEAVSMIPATYLTEENPGKGSDMYWLDLCAAPGSKTSQLLENLDVRRRLSQEPMPRGVVLANDLNPTRAHMLLHHVKFQNSTSLCVTLHNAAIFPRLWEGTHRIGFDGVLCDVPCSGDGTFRKNPGAWRKWNALEGINLHRVQMRILKKGATLCKVGGRLVYSTCSLNPIENEAVVAGVLRFAEDSLRIESREISGLKKRGGLDQWSFYLPPSKQSRRNERRKQNKEENTTEHVSSEGRWFNTFDEVPEALKLTKIFPSMFPPTETEEHLRWQLKNGCQRYYPHDNDTGGFFVCVFRKVDECPWERPRSRPQDIDRVEGTATGADPVVGDAEDDDEDEVAIAAAETAGVNAKSDCTEKQPKTSTDGLATEQQTDLISIYENPAMMKELRNECLDVFGLPSTPAEGAPDLGGRLWGRHRGEERMPIQQRKKARLAAKAETDEHETAVMVVEGQSVEEHGSAAAPADKTVARSGHVLPRKVWIVSEGVSRILKAKAFKNGLRVCGAGSIFSDCRAQSKPRPSSQGYELFARWTAMTARQKQRLGALSAGPSLKGVSVRVVSSEILRALLDGVDEDVDADDEKDTCEDDGQQGNSNEIEEEALQGKENVAEFSVMGKDGGTEEVVATKRSRGSAIRNIVKCPSKHEQFSRLNFGCLPDDHPVKKFFTTQFDKEGHYIFLHYPKSDDPEEILKVFADQESTTVCVPVFVGKRNAEILICAAVRRSLFSLLAPGGSTTQMRLPKIQTSG